MIASSMEEICNEISKALLSQEQLNISECSLLEDLCLKISECEEKINGASTSSHKNKRKLNALEELASVTSEGNYLKKLKTGHKIAHTQLVKLGKMIESESEDTRWFNQTNAGTEKSKLLDQAIVTHLVRTWYYTNVHDSLIFKAARGNLEAAKKLMEESKSKEQEKHLVIFEVMHKIVRGTSTCNVKRKRLTCAVISA